MLDKIKSENEELAFLSRLMEVSGRRTFLKWSGLSIVAVTVGCKATDSVAPGGVAGSSSAAGISLGTGDVLVLNFAYALEQLEAAFYTQVIATQYAGITPAEFQVLDDLRKHEIVHREFLKAALGTSAIPSLQVTFASVDFTSRASVLGAAKVFEDVGVSAYNGAAKFLVNLDYLTVAGKIVSVEARHAAAIRDLLAPKTASFAGDDVVDANGLDVVRTPLAALTAASPFIVTEIDPTGVPNT